MAEVTVTNVSAETTFTATYSNATATCIVTVGPATLSLATNKSILSQYHSDSATLTATYSLGAGGTVELYNSNDVKIGTFTDAGGGTYTYSLASTGAGDLSLYAKCSGVTSSNVSIEDCFLYSTTEISRTSTYNTDKYATMFSNFSFTSDSYLCELDIKYTNASTGFGVAPTGRTDPYHEIDFADSLQSNKHIQSMYTTAGTYRYDEISTNTYYTIKFTYVNGILTVYINGTQKGSYSNLSAYNEDTREIYWYEWSSGRTTYVKNVKIKSL